VRIAHVNSNYGPNVFYRQLYDIQCRSHDLSVFVPSRVPGAVSRASHGEYAHEVHIAGTRNPLRFVSTYADVYERLTGDLAEFGPDLVHAHTLFSNGVLAYWAWKQFGVPYVVAVRSTDIWHFLHLAPHLIPLGVRILRHAHRVVFLSAASRSVALKRLVPPGERVSFEKRSVIIPNGLDSFWHDNLGDRKTGPGSRVVFCVVGGIMPRKNQVETALRVEREMRGIGLEWSLSVMGMVQDTGGPFGRGAGERMARRLAEMDHVSMRGFGGPDAVRAVMDESHVFILLSRRETFGRVYIEAMSRGLPVIYSRGEGFDQLFPEGEVGFSVDPRRGRCLGGVVARILRDYANMSERCLSRAEECGWEGIARSYESLYASL